MNKLTQNLKYLKIYINKIERKFNAEFLTSNIWRFFENSYRRNSPNDFIDIFYFPSFW